MPETSTMSFRRRPVIVHILLAALAGVLLVAPVALAGNGNPARDAYFRYCSACHGVTGQGDGEVAASMRPRPADLTLLAQKHGGTFPYQYARETIDGRQRVAAHGSSQMPVWGQVFVEEKTYEKPEAHARSQISLILSYLASIQTVQPRPTLQAPQPD